jgi:hypothetical protein
MQVSKTLFVLKKLDFTPKITKNAKKVVLHRYTMHTDFATFFFLCRLGVSRYKLEVGISGLKSQALSPP